MSMHTTRHEAHIAQLSADINKEYSNKYSDLWLGATVVGCTVQPLKRQIIEQVWNDTAGR